MHHLGHLTTHIPQLQAERERGGGEGERGGGEGERGGGGERGEEGRERGGGRQPVYQSIHGIYS